MKKFIFVSFITLLLVFSSSAYSAEGGWYIRGGIGPALLNDTDTTLSEAEIEAQTGVDVPAGTTDTIELEFDESFFINLAPGYNFGNFRLESEFAYQVNNIGKINETLNSPGVAPVSTSSYPVGGDVTNLSLLFNGYYDFLKGNEVQPYITAGIGVARVIVQLEGEEDTDSTFAYKVGVGLSYNMSENVALDFGYRYFATSDIDVTGAEFPNSSHLILLGARYNF